MWLTWDPIIITKSEETDEWETVGTLLWPGARGATQNHPHIQAPCLELSLSSPCWNKTMCLHRMGMIYS